MQDVEVIMLKIIVKRLGFAGAMSVGLLMCASSVQASDISPFDLIEAYKTETKSQNYTKLSPSISEKEAMALDKTFSKHFGEPAVTRNGVKVWEVPNSNARKGEAKHITVTCGPHGNGFYISVDARGAGEGNHDEKRRYDHALEKKQLSLQAPTKSNAQIKPASRQTLKSKRRHQLKPHLRDDAN